MPIPFPPDGPQVQAALQKVPTPQLQNYAAGRPPQPTGQVTPGPMGAAAEALNARGAIGAANQRQQAMQNNPANSPTIFQQKDMELQQKAQQLAAMGQQIQQKEQQLGVLGALMAKKAQDMQARESMGVANLPIRPDMFTAMNGGIVFSGGGGVEGYASRGLVGKYNPVPKTSLLESAGISSIFDEITDEKSKEELEKEDILNRLRDPGRNLKTFAEESILSPEARETAKTKRIKELTEQYDKYKQGIAGLDEEAAAAIRGKPANTMQGIAAGLGALPADLRNVRLAGLMAKLSGGVAGERARAEDRETKANIYLTEAKRKRAEAEFAEERGRPDLAKKAADEEQALLDKVYGRQKDVASTEMEGAKAAATYLTGQDKLEATQLARARANELKEQQLKINEALATGRINQMQATAATAALNQQFKALEMENKNLQTQIQLGGMQAQVRERVDRALQNDPAYFRLSTSIDKLMRKDKLSKEEDAKLDLLLEQRNQLVNAKEEEYGLNKLPSPRAAPLQTDKPLPNKVLVGGKSFNRPSNFTDEQWRKYIKDTGAKAE